METLIRFGEITSGYLRPVNPVALRETGRVEPFPGAGVGQRGRLVEPKELLRDFLSINFQEPRDIEAYLERNGVPVKHWGRSGRQEDYPDIVAFNELAYLAREAVPENQIERMRTCFLRALEYGTEFYFIDELAELQREMRRLTDAISEPLAEKTVPNRYAVSNLNAGLSAGMVLSLEPVKVGKKEVKALVLETQGWDFETRLCLGILQGILELTPIRQCHQCGRYFEMRQRRTNRRFCDFSCKYAWFNDKRRRKRELATQQPNS
ncbi:MAG: hypothetical protein IIB88_01940 [Chloroflexi bacterium]|nr:hypothetical protein [Chloroflexota bacterium]